MTKNSRSRLETFATGLSHQSGFGTASFPQLVKVD
jgi:hypothetical protein